MSEEHARLFVAVAVPEEVRAAVADAVAALRGRGGKLRWTDPGNWHLTLAFLGETPLERLGEIEAACAQAAAEAAPLTLRLDGSAGHFRRAVLWARLADAPALDALAARVRELLVPVRPSLAEERPFHAHLTLARARRGQQVPRRLVEAYDGPAVTWTVTELELLRSRLGQGPDGSARYEPLATWPLGRPPPQGVASSLR